MEKGIIETKYIKNKGYEYVKFSILMFTGANYTSTNNNIK